MIEIIPAMDLIGGKCVRLTQGDFSRETVYSDDPLETAKRFEAAGLKRLHMVDLDGARSGTPANLHVLKHVASGTSLNIDYGGGIKSEADLAAVFGAGASMVNIGSLAARQPETFLGWVDKYGGDRMLLGADTKKGKVAIDAWRTETREPILSYLRKYAERGVTKAFVTDIVSDGTMEGPSIKLYKKILGAVQEIDLIASGGVRSIDDIDELEKIGCAGVIVGRALYERTIKLEDLAKYAG
ncbi:MAG TPA: 1-(5-phosphoribosyl)-5-[(5-phosphoribosylamino)methylideneamino]imidazole-4-carboxamide isomerase [Pyrinomonadaceae bacterium]|nr:1-(5-phosphoribosyl)-5-[(5-phosphoribosylamino)methylideneamino]imidazole-4-carboxamide isomerase [Pyrinomonadaceae bacterium]